MARLLHPTRSRPLDQVLHSLRTCNHTLSLPRSLLITHHQPTTRNASTTTPSSPANGSERGSGKGRYPLYPSVQHLISSSKLFSSDLQGISPSGPNGRLLKGDILAFLGKIPSSYPAESAARIKTLGELDLENVQIAEPTAATGTGAAGTAAAAADEPAAAAATEASETDSALRISTTIDLEPVFALQSRLSRVLGIDVPVSTFLDRASSLANHNLPSVASGHSRSNLSSSEDLFNSILGLPSRSARDAGSRFTARGSFVPILDRFDPHHEQQAVQQAESSRQRDIFDEILDTGNSSKRTKSGMTPSSTRTTTPGSRSMRGMGTGREMGTLRETENIVSVLAPQGQERRAEVFLSQMKDVLELEPGSLVL